MLLPRARQELEASKLPRIVPAIAESQVLVDNSNLIDACTCGNCIEMPSYIENKCCMKEDMAKDANYHFTIKL